MQHTPFSVSGRSCLLGDLYDMIQHVDYFLVQFIGLSQRGQAMIGRLAHGIAESNPQVEFRKSTIQEITPLAICPETMSEILQRNWGYEKLNDFIHNCGAPVSFLFPSFRKNRP